jgi:hypothetical protein
VAIVASVFDVLANCIKTESAHISGFFDGEKPSRNQASTEPLGS